ncbi:MAG: xylulokinase [Planctomycetia bacterium]|nr:xylulokinase [Planctomycetia bacterium]
MFVLGIDFGGGACKATLLADNGTIAAVHTVEYSTNYPEPGHAEQNPEDWFAATCSSIAAILSEHRVSPKEIAAISLSAATHIAVLLDEHDHVLAPAIYWTDSRSIAEVQKLKEEAGELIEQLVLHRPDTIWTMPQLLWISRHWPDVWSQTKKILFAKDYVRHRLTGDYVTDYIEAEGSMLFDYHKLEWSNDLCDLIDLKADRLPRIVDPMNQTGMVTKQAAELTGLAEGTPVLCGTTDTAMEVFASGAIRRGQMTIKLATAGRVCVVTEQPWRNANLINYSHIIRGLWYPGTATKSCAASYRWFRDTFGGDYEKWDEAANSVSPGADGLIFHPYLNGELTPYADPFLCGSFIGIRSGHRKEHFARAVLEGVAMSLLDCKTAIDDIRIPYDHTAFVIGGGSQSPLWRQIIADTLGMSLVLNERSDSSFGSAMLAGIAIGMFQSPEGAIDTCTRKVARNVPNMENNKIYSELFCKYKAVHDSLAPLYRQWWSS